jgi:hypothetical protein
VIEKHLRKSWNTVAAYSTVTYSTVTYSTAAYSTAAYSTATATRTPTMMRATPAIPKIMRLVSEARKGILQFLLMKNECKRNLHFCSIQK